MPKYFLRVEQVNFDNVIGDTTDLSTVRGGGLLALSCAQSLNEDRSFKEVLKPFYMASSSGLFSFEYDSEEKAEALRINVAKKLQENFPDGTYSVEFCEEGEFGTSIQTLQAKARWRQMQSPQLIYPGFGEKVCELNQILPATDVLKAKGGGELDVSRSVHARRKYGLGEKHTEFYQKFAAWPKGREFTNDFDQLSDYEKMGRLHHKIAVIYLDGNGFGGRFSACGKEEYADFSRLLRANSSSFLNCMLSEIWVEQEKEIAEGGGKARKTKWTWSGKYIDNVGKVHDKKDAIRLETLLWGGDEIIWVVPAWLGWWWLEKFFAKWGNTKEWDGQKPGLEFPIERLKETKKLTHGAGMVFCHHNAPIRRISSLARLLAETPKKGKNDNRFAYQVLESFDHLGTDAIGARGKRLPAKMRGDGESDSEYLVFRGEAMGGIRQAIHQLKGLLPRSHVYDVVRALSNGSELTAAIELGNAVLNRSQRMRGRDDARACLNELAQALSGKTGEAGKSETWQAAAWIHLSELWDYLPEIQTGARS